jgi:cellulose synthase operon protein YhjQ
MPLIFFGSPKGGVGKTTIAANTAAALAAMGFRVTVLDLDPQNAMRLHFGIPLQDSAGFASALTGSAAPSPLAASLRGTPWGIGVLPFGQTDTAGALAVSDSLKHHPERLTQPLQDLLADPRAFILIDSPPGPSPVLAAVLPYTDLLVCVLLADAMSVALIPEIEAGRAFGPGTQRGAEGGRLRYVLNQFDHASRLSRATVEAVRPYLGVRLLGEVQRDELVAEAAAAQSPLPYFAPASPAVAEFRQIALNIAAAFGMAPHWGTAA